MRAISECNTYFTTIVHCRCGINETQILLYGSCVGCYIAIQTRIISQTHICNTRACDINIQKLTHKVFTIEFKDIIYYATVSIILTNGLYKSVTIYGEDIVCHRNIWRITQKDI